jgi:hypothetical protein
MHSAEFSIVQSESDGPMRGRLQEMPEGRYDNLHDILHPKRRTRHRDAIARVVWLPIEAAGPDDHALVASNRSFQPAAQKFLRDISLSLWSLCSALYGIRDGGQRVVACRKGRSFVRPLAAPVLNCWQ